MKVGGKTVADLVVMPVDELIAFFAGLELDGHDTKTAARILVEIRNRLQYLADVGLGYLTLDRLSSTYRAAKASASTSRRRWAATSRGRSTSSTSLIGLHPRDTNRLIKVLQQLRCATWQHGDRRGARGGGDPRRRHIRRHRPQGGLQRRRGGLQRHAAQLLKAGRASRPTT